MSSANRTKRWAWHLTVCVCIVYCRNKKTKEVREARTAKIQAEQLKEVRPPALTKRSLRMAEARRVQEDQQQYNGSGGDGSGNWSRMASLTPRQQRWAAEAQR